MYNIGRIYFIKELTVVTSVKKIASRKLKKDIKKEEVVSNEKKQSKENKSNTEIKAVDKIVKRVRQRKIRATLLNVEETKLDKEIEKEDNMSIAIVMIILFFCFIVGIALGYLLYKIAITGSL